MTAPLSLAEAWAIEVAQRGGNPSTPGYDDAQNLFYSGAAAMLSMVAAAGANGTISALALLESVQDELREYLKTFPDA
jgi:hypothetical protein